MFKNFILTFSAILFYAVGAQAQTTEPTPPPDVPTIIGEAAKQQGNYREAFKNLLAVETKTSTKFDKTGAADKPNVVESDFLVYQSSKDANSIAELRNVTKVDGKVLPDSQKRSDELFAELKKSATKKKELDRIQSEGSRYDKNFEISGITLSEALPLSAKLQPYFDFKFAGIENYQGADVYVINYLQTKKSPLILLNAKSDADDETVEFNIDLPGALKKSDAFLRGKLGIDPQTFRVRREERELFVQPENPIVLLTTSLEYQPSDYEIFVPKKIVLTFFNLKKKDKKYNSTKDFETAFEYFEIQKNRNRCQNFGRRKLIEILTIGNAARLFSSAAFPVFTRV